MIFDRVMPDVYDYNALVGFRKLDTEQQRSVHLAYEHAYMRSKHLGVKVATGMGYEAAKLALEQALQPRKEYNIVQPTSIFDGLDNCE